MFSIVVPTNAITKGTTVTITSTVTVVSTPSHINAGAIAGGVISCVVVLGAMFAFAWYRIRLLKKSEVTGSTRSGEEGAESRVQTIAPDNIPSENVLKQ